MAATAASGVEWRGKGAPHPTSLSDKKIIDNINNNVTHNTPPLHTAAIARTLLSLPLDVASLHRCMPPYASVIIRCHRRYTPLPPHTTIQLHLRTPLSPTYIQLCTPPHASPPHAPPLPIAASYRRRRRTLILLKFPSLRYSL